MRNGLVVDDGVQRWYKDDKLHKEDGPAVVRADGTQQWFREGKSIESPSDAVSTELRSIAAQLVALAKKV